MGAGTTLGGRELVAATFGGLATGGLTSCLALFGLGSDALLRLGRDLALLGLHRCALLGLCLSTRLAGLALLLAGCDAELLAEELTAKCHELLLAAAMIIELLGGAETGADAPIDEALPHIVLARVAMGCGALFAEFAGPVNKLAVELLTEAETSLEQ